MTLARPPGPPEVRSDPVSLIRYLRQFQKDGIGLVGRRFEQYGDVYYNRFRGRDLYVVRHPEQLWEVLVSRGQDFEKPSTGLTARGLRRFLGDGLVTSNGELWRRQRRRINPGFARRRLMDLGEPMVEEALAHRERVTAGATLDVGRQMMGLTLSIVARTLFDHRVDNEADRIAVALDAFRTSSAGSGAVLPHWLPVPSVRRVNRALRDIDQIVYGLIDERRAEASEARSQRRDLLSLLVDVAEAGEDHDNGNNGNNGEESMTRKLLRDEILTLFLAGHETTSQALVWTFLLLSENPEAESRLHAELDEVLAGRAPTHEDALPWTDAVLTEAMRLFPPVTTIPRVSACETQIGPWTVPAGADVICWVYFAHLDPRWFPDPEAYRPERWLDNPDVPRGAYAPFGAGQRQCIGKHFALLEARLILAAWAQKWRMERVDDEPVRKRIAVTLSPAAPLRMRAVARAT